MNKGIIACDIDGTLTDQLDSIPTEVVQALNGWREQGWVIALMTGRTFSYTEPILKQLSFPYYLSVQNGSDILHMPSMRHLKHFYLPGTILKDIQQVYETEDEDFIVYAGFKKGDYCYYRPHRFSSALQDYLTILQNLPSAPWREVHTFEDLDRIDFPLIKCFGPPEKIEKVATKLSLLEGTASSVIRDPICPDYALYLLTHHQATKGEALSYLAYIANAPYLIAAGDDRNDLSMIEKAHGKIVMQTAPADVLAKATVVSRPARELGIIAALEEAVSHASS